MIVYVEPAAHPFGNMVMCHLWADTLNELLAMVDHIGVARRWIQGHPTLSFGRHRNATWIHFDIARGKRVLALAAGAIATDRYGPVEHVARLHIASGDPHRIALGEHRLAQVASCRARQQEPV